MIPDSAPPPTERILGIPFFTGTIEEACARARQGGLVVAPSGPGLADDLIHQPDYRAALAAGDLVLTDSGFLVLLWWLRTGRRLPRHSGLKFLQACLRRHAPTSRIFWVMPGEDEMRRNFAWLERCGLPAATRHGYVAPFYGPGPIVDLPLRDAIESCRPDFVIIAIGGGVQERLGHALQKQLSFRPGILCLGAAIAFLSGVQVRIPRWVDRMMLGWLWRAASAPGTYGPRYLRALPLAWLVLRYGRAAPPDAIRRG
jgi:UDP-N-acetyl-D-mannosaminuronic acid transferase (WecB/TagA/CpsF family)